MDSATRSAAELNKRLTLDMNKIRQAAITKELIEIVSGAARRIWIPTAQAFYSPMSRFTCLSRRKKTSHSSFPDTLTRANFSRLCGLQNVFTAHSYTG